MSNWIKDLIYLLSSAHAADQAWDGGGMVPQSPWFRLLVVWGGHQHTAEFWGPVRESRRSGGWSHSKCQRKGKEVWLLHETPYTSVARITQDQLLNLNPKRNESVAASVFYRLLLMPSDWSMPTWWCWVMSQDKPHLTWVIWTSPQSR